MHILVHEPDHRGHRFTTVRVLIDALLEVRQALEHSEKDAPTLSIYLATTRSGIESDAFREQLSPVADQFELLMIPEIGIEGNAVLRTIKRFQGLKAALASQRIDHLYLPYADGILQLMALFRYVPGMRVRLAHLNSEALIMQNSFAYPNATRNRRWRAIMGIRHCGCQRVHVNDPMAWEYLQANKVADTDHVRLVPDPITDTQVFDKRTARQALGLPLDARIAGTVGVINNRKGADVLVKSFLQAPLTPADHLLLAGKFTPAIRALVDEANDPRIICMDRYLSEEELSQALSAMDLVVTAYPTVIGSASIVIRAASAGRRVLGSNTNWIGHIVPAFKLGDTAPATDLAQFSSQLADSLALAPDHVIDPEARRFASFNTAANVRAHWSALIRKRLGVSPHPELVSW